MRRVRRDRGAERSAYLDGACGADANLRARVDKAADKQTAAQPLIESLREAPADAELHSKLRALLEEPK